MFGQKIFAKIHNYTNVIRSFFPQCAGDVVERSDERIGVGVLQPADIAA